MKRHIACAAALVLALLLSLSACAPRTKTLTEDELARIHRTEQELRDKLVGIT